MLWPFGVLAILLLVYAYIKQKQIFEHWQVRNVPHIKPSFLFGSLWPVILRRSTMPEVMHKMYRHFEGHRYFGFFHFSRASLVLMDLELIKQIFLKEFVSFPDHSDVLPGTSDPFWRRGLIAREGKEWHDMRVTLSPVFSASKMKAMFHLMSECAEEFVNYYSKMGAGVLALDMRDVFTRYTNDAFASSMLGIRCNSLEQPNNEFFLVGKEAFDFSGWKGLRFFGAAISPTLMNLFKVTLFGKRTKDFFTKAIKETIKIRRQSEIVRPDMIHLLMEAQKGRLKNDNEDCDEDDSLSKLKLDNGKLLNHKMQELTDDDIVIQTVVFYFGGYDAVASLLCNASYELATHPAIQEKLIKEIDQILGVEGKLSYQALSKMNYLDMVVAETLRLWTAGFYISRKCAKPFTIEPVLPGENPVHLDIGDDVIVPVYALHRDPKYYPNPDEFNPERFSAENKDSLPMFSYIPFGIGPRMCIGKRFVLLKTKIALFHILSKFSFVPVEKTTPSFVIDPAYSMLQKKGGYWLGMKARN